MKSLKTCFAAFAVAAAVCAHAQDDEKETSSSAVGWTPIAVGLASPVQIPWGAAKWDVYGLDLNLFYSDAPKMYGLDVAGLAAVTRNDMKGLQLAGLFNYGLSVACVEILDLLLKACDKAFYIRKDVACQRKGTDLGLELINNTEYICSITAGKTRDEFL